MQSQKKSPEDSYKIVDSQGSGRTMQRKHFFDIETHGAEVLALRFDQEDTMLAAGQSDGKIKIFHLHSNQLKHTLSILDDPNSKSIVPCTTLRWRPPSQSSKNKNVLVSGGADGSIIHWHVSSNGKQLHKIVEEDNQIFALDYNKEGSQFATAGKDKIIRIYDEETHKVQVSLSGVGWKEAGHNNRIFACKFIQEDSNLLISGGWDQNIIVWDIREGKQSRSIVGPKICGEAVDVKNGQILTGANRAKNQLQLWDFGTCKPIKDIEWEPGQSAENGAFVFAAQFSKVTDDTLLAASTGLNQARIFDINKDHRPISTLVSNEKGLYTVDYANTSNKFAISGAEGYIWVYTLVNN